MDEIRVSVEDNDVISITKTWMDLENRELLTEYHIPIFKQLHKKKKKTEREVGWLSILNTV